MSYRMDRRAYAETFGPTIGDRVRLADTDLFIEVKEDFTTYGDEVKFGGGKVFETVWDNLQFPMQMVQLI